MNTYHNPFLLLPKWKKYIGSSLRKTVFFIKNFNFIYHLKNFQSKYHLHKWSKHKNITKEHENRLFISFLPILQTKPLKCNPKASVELHTVSGHFHLTMYILAIKSLLRFYTNIAIVVHDGDGLFTMKDLLLLQKHIIGIKIIKKGYADKKMGIILKNFPKVLKYRAKMVNSFEILDNLALARTSRIITMNSDVLFFKEPTQLIKWLKNKKPPITYVHEKKPITQREFLKETKCNFPPHLTLALVCAYKDVINYPIIENVLTTSKIAKSHLWQLGQCIFPLMLDQVSSKYKFQSFDKKKFESSGIFKKSPIFRHYWSSTGLFTEKHIFDAKKVMAEIGYI